MITMAQIFWRELYCPSCKKVTTHRHSIKQDGSFIVGEDGKIESKGNFVDAFSNPDVEWECWTCRTKGRESIRKAEPIIEEQTDAYLTVFPKSGEPKNDYEILQFEFDNLAKVVSYLEDRIAVFEKIILGKEKRRAIRIKKEDSIK